MESSACWKCGSYASCLLCPGCQALQRPPSGYFEFFDFPEYLSLDTTDLQKRFYELSRALHPDRFTQRPQIEREHSLQATAILNDGYRTLKDPVKRAEYVMSRHGLDIGEQRSKNVPPELLEEVFELNMALEEIRGGDESVRPQVEAARTKFRGLLAGIDTELEAQFRAFDAAGEADRTAVLNALRGILNRRRYIQNLVSEVEKELAPATT